MTLSTYAASWLAYAKLDRAAGTVRRYKATLDNVCRDLGETDLAEIRAQHLKDWHLRRSAEVAASTLTVDVVVVKALFSTAHKEGVLESNPAATLRKPPREAPKDDLGVSWERAREAIQEHVEEPSRSALLLLLATGLRIGELLALRWEDVAGGVVRVRPKDGWRPKTRSSTRRVPLGPLGGRALAVLGAYPHNGRLLELGLSVRGSEDRLRKALKAACEATGLRVLTPHKLRHAYATKLEADGVHPDIERRLLGHANLATMQRYLHPDEEAMRKAVRGL